MFGDRDRLEELTEQVNDLLDQAKFVRARRRAAEAARLARQLYEETGLNGEAQMLANALIGLGRAEARLGNLDKAEKLLTEVLELRRSDPFVNPEDLFEALTELALVYLDAGEPDKADPLVAEALENERQATIPDTSRLGWALVYDGVVQLQYSRWQQAEARFREALEVLSGYPESTTEVTNYLLECLGMYLDQRMRDEQVNEGMLGLLQMLGELAREEDGADPRLRVNALVLLADGLDQASNRERAEATAREAISLGTSLLEADDATLAPAHELLGHFSSNEKEKIANLTRAVEIYANFKDHYPGAYIDSLLALIETKLRTGETREAVETWESALKEFPTDEDDFTELFFRGMLAIAETGSEDEPIESALARARTIVKAVTGHREYIDHVLAGETDLDEESDTFALINACIAAEKILRQAGCRGEAIVPLLVGIWYASDIDTHWSDETLAELLDDAEDVLVDPDVEQIARHNLEEEFAHAKALLNA